MEIRKPPTSSLSRASLVRRRADGVLPERREKTRREDAQGGAPERTGSSNARGGIEPRRVEARGATDEESPVRRFPDGIGVRARQALNAYRAIEEQVPDETRREFDRLFGIDEYV